MEQKLSVDFGSEAQVIIERRSSDMTEPRRGLVSLLTFVIFGLWSEEWRLYNPSSTRFIQSIVNDVEPKVKDTM